MSTMTTPPRHTSRGTQAHLPDRGVDGSTGDKEVHSPMMLTTMLDLKASAEQQGTEVPCREYDAELWFAERPDDVEFAKALCGMCPARAQCFSGAIERAEPWGVWGGQLFVQGAVVARKRPRGRPRKNEVAA